MYTIFMLWRDFNKVNDFRSTRFLIVVNFIFFLVISQMGYCWQTLRQHLVRLSSYFHLSVRGLPHNPTSLFLFFSYCFSAEGADVGSKDCVIVFFIGNTNGKFFKHIATYHALEICSWWASHHVVCISYPFCVPDLSICEAFFIFFNSFQKCDVTLLAVGFTVMIV